jgi:hypothetical protein
MKPGLFFQAKADRPSLRGLDLGVTRSAGETLYTLSLNDAKSNNAKKEKQQARSSAALEELELERTVTSTPIAPDPVHARRGHTSMPARPWPFSLNNLPCPRCPSARATSRQSVHISQATARRLLRWRPIASMSAWAARFPTASRCFRVVNAIIPMWPPLPLLALNPLTMRRNLGLARQRAARLDGCPEAPGVLRCFQAMDLGHDTHERKS